MNKDKRKKREKRKAKEQNLIRAKRPRVKRKKDGELLGLEDHTKIKG